MRRGRGGTTATLDPTLLRRPSLAPDVMVHAPAEPDAPWIVQRGAHHYIRAGADMVALLQSIDGVRDHADLVRTLGPPWTEPDVGRAVASLSKLQLLDDGSRRGGSVRWFSFVPPLTLQLTLLRPVGLLARLGPLIRLLATRPARILAAAVVVGGLGSLAAQAPALHQAFGRPLPLAVLLAITVASLATTALHEMGHGAVLTHYGGRPSRMGVMLFYLSPAFFCDVSDGWRLPRKVHRVWVALAGIVTQLVVAGSVAIAAAAVTATGASPAVRDGMLVFAVSTFVAGVLNLLPFVKLDGYIALMSHLDLSHLRDRAMTDGRRFVARVLFGGGTYRRELAHLPWATGFGLVCIAFPLYLIGLAATLWLDLLQGMGVIGASVVLVGVGYLLYRAVVGVRLLVREARSAGAGRLRIGVAGALIAAGAGAVLTLVTVPYTVTGGFVQEPGGARLVLADSADRAAIDEGAPVTLHRRGLVTRTAIGTAAVGPGEAQVAIAPLSAFLPVTDGDSVPVLAWELPLVAASGPDVTVGTATVAAGDLPMGHWLFRTYIAPAWR